jgi:aminoglycoside N3'-acetyltransferase
MYVEANDVGSVNRRRNEFVSAYRTQRLMTNSFDLLREEHIRSRNQTFTPKKTTTSDFGKPQKLSSIANTS